MSVDTNDTLVATYGKQTAERKPSADLAPDGSDQEPRTEIIKMNLGKEANYFISLQEYPQPSQLSLDRLRDYRIPMTPQELIHTATYFMDAVPDTDDPLTPSAYNNESLTDLSDTEQTTIAAEMLDTALELLSKQKQAEAGTDASYAEASYLLAVIARNAYAQNQYKPKSEQPKTFNSPVSSDTAIEHTDKAIKRLESNGNLSAKENVLLGDLQLLKTELVALHKLSSDTNEGSSSTNEEKRTRLSSQDAQAFVQELTDDKEAIGHRVSYSIKTLEARFPDYTTEALIQFAQEHKNLINVTGVSPEPQPTSQPNPDASREERTLRAVA